MAEWNPGWSRRIPVYSVFRDEETIMVTDEDSPLGRRYAWAQNGRAAAQLIVDLLNAYERTKERDYADWRTAGVERPA